MKISATISFISRHTQKLLMQNLVKKGLTWTVGDAVERGAAHSESGHGIPAFGVEHQEVAVAGAHSQNHSIWVEADRHALQLRLQFSHMSDPDE